MTAAEKVLAVARSQIGTRESPAGSNRQKYGAAYGMNGQPWCVIFLWWCFREAGLSHLFYDGRRCASCTTLRNWAKLERRWIPSGFRAGDLVQMDFGSDGVPDHIGIVERVDAKGQILVTIEGNTGAGNDANGGQVQRRTRPASLVVGAVRPEYAKEDRDMDVEKIDFSRLTDAQAGQLVSRLQEYLGSLPASPALLEMAGEGVTDGSAPRAFATRIQAAVMCTRAKDLAVRESEAKAAEAARKAVASALAEIARGAANLAGLPDS